MGFYFFFLNCVTAVQLCDGGNEKAKDEILRVSCTVWSIKLSTLAHTRKHTHTHTGVGDLSPALTSPP